MIWIVPGGGRVGCFRLHEPDVLPDFFGLYGFVQVFADEQRFPQLVVAETAAGARYGVLALAVALDHPLHPLGGDAIGVVHHFNENEMALFTISIQIQYSLSCGA